MIVYGPAFAPLAETLEAQPYKTLQVLLAAYLDEGNLLTVPLRPAAELIGYKSPRVLNRHLKELRRLHVLALVGRKLNPNRALLLVNPAVASMRTDVDMAEALRRFELALSGDWTCPNLFFDFGTECPLNFSEATS